jgi:hypothetical protein
MTKKTDSGIITPARVKALVCSAEALLQQLDPHLVREATWVRPLAIELLGSPASGKSTAQGVLRHFFRRNKFLVHAPREGAEAIEGPRQLPDYNMHTTEWALHHARMLRHSKAFHLGIFDRAILDGVVRMELYASEGRITSEEQKIIEGYFLLPFNADLFDLHVFLMCGPQTTFDRKRKVEVVDKPGPTLNPATLSKLYDTHRRVWERLGGSENQKLLWLDSDELNQIQVAEQLIGAILAAFERHLAAK